MENTLQIEVIDEKAMGMIHEMEALHLIRVVQEQVGHETIKTRLSDKYRGMISKEEAKELNDHIDIIRKEWPGI